MERVIKVIRSCETLGHLVMAKRMAARFMEMYGDDHKTEVLKELTGLPCTGKIYGQVFGAFSDQRDRINHLNKLNKTDVSL